MTPTLRAAIWMLGAIAAFSTMAIAGRALADTLDTFEIMMYRSFVGIIIVCTAISAKGIWHQVTRRNLGSQILRNAAHFTGQNLWFFAVTAIPLAQVFALEFTSPLWVIGLSVFLLGERLTKVRVLAGVLGFIGILIVARPGTAQIGPGVIAAATAAIFFAITIVMTKRLTRTETTACILFWLTLSQVVMGLIFAGFDGDIALPQGAALFWVLLVGLAGLMAHFCMTNALSLAPATVVVPVDFARLPVIAIAAMLIYDEPLDIWVFVGAGVIFAGNYLNIYSETRRNRVA